MLLGAPAGVVPGDVALTRPVLPLQHANLPFAAGWLNDLFSTNEVHCWHHSSVPAEAHRNYGRTIALWDRRRGAPIKARRTGP